jgi:hypothetical protein
MKTGAIYRLVLAAGLLVPALAHAQPLASGELRIAGVQLAVSPASQTVPRNQATALQAMLVDPSDPGQPATLPAEFVDGLVVKGELSGPGLAAPQTLSAAFADAEEPGTVLLPVPALLANGNYVVDNLRLEDADGNFIVPAEPAVATLDVIDKVIVTSVSSRPLSLEEIQQKGIVIDDSNFTAYEFTFGVATESGQVPISFDVAFPQDAEVEEEGGGFHFPPVLPQLDIPNLEVKGLLFNTPLDFDEPVEIPPIPAVVVIPGNIAFLNQFFQVIVLVSNAAPAGSRLVVTSATATMMLPVGPDLVPESPDDPLARVDVPGTQDGGLTAGVRNKTTGAPEFGPGEDASGELVVEGKKEGTHRIRE